MHRRGRCCSTSCCTVCCIITWKADLDRRDCGFAWALAAVLAALVTHHAGRSADVRPAVLYAISAPPTSDLQALSRSGRADRGFCSWRHSSASWTRTGAVRCWLRRRGVVDLASAIFSLSGAPLFLLPVLLGFEARAPQAYYANVARHFAQRSSACELEATVWLWLARVLRARLQHGER